MRLPPKKRPGNPILASDWNALIDALAARTPRPSAGMELVFTSSGFAFRARSSSSAESGGGTPCPFGEIITWKDGTLTKTGIRGGLIHCGDQNWNLDPQELNPQTNGVWLVSIGFEVEVNRDDDGELLLPAVKTGTRPTGNWTQTAWSEGTDYPANTAPVVSTGKGNIVLPVGKLTINGGSVRLEPTGCGPFTIKHCAGTLSYSRE